MPREKMRVRFYDSRKHGTRRTAHGEARRQIEQRLGTTSGRQFRKARKALRRAARTLRGEG